VRVAEQPSHSGAQKKIPGWHRTAAFEGPAADQYFALSGADGAPQSPAGSFAGSAGLAAGLPAASVAAAAATVASAAAA